MKPSQGRGPRDPSRVSNGEKNPTTNLKTSPFEGESYDEMFIQPAVQGTMNVIKATSHYCPTTKRIVITASIISILEWHQVFRAQKPHFDSNHVGPSFTIGKHELAGTRAEVLAGTYGAAPRTCPRFWFWV